MNQTVNLGPLAFPVWLLLGLAALACATATASWLQRRRGVQVETQLYLLLATGLVAARGAFVARYWEDYAREPLSLLDIRDGGFVAWAGLAAAGLHALVLGWRRPALRVALPACLGAAAIVWTAGLLVFASGPAQRVELPAVSLQTPAGVTVPLRGFAGRPVVVNLWATWCPPCRREMPVLLKAQQQHPGVHFVFVNQAETGQRVAAFLQTGGLPLANVLLDPTSSLGALLGARGLPTTFFFDAQGRLVDTRVGELSQATLAQRLEAITTDRVRPPAP